MVLQVVNIQASGGDAAKMALAEVVISDIADIGDITDPYEFRFKNEAFLETAATIWTDDYGQTATNNLTLMPQAGDGFADVNDYDASGGDVPLDYHITSGARIDTATSIVWTFGASHMTIQELQFRKRNKYSAGTDYFDATDILHKRCIWRFRSSFTFANHTNDRMENCLIVGTDASGGGNNFLGRMNNEGSGTLVLINSIFCVARNSSSNLSAVLNTNYTNALTIDQCMFYHLNAEGGDADPIEYDGTGTTVGDWNIQNGAGSGEVLPTDGSNSSTSGVIAADFIDAIVASQEEAFDRRHKVGGLGIAFIDEGSEDATTPSVDIRGALRLQSGQKTDCGCFQVTVAASGLGVPEIATLLGRRNMLPIDPIRQM